MNFRKALSRVAVGGAVMSAAVALAMPASMAAAEFPEFDFSGCPDLPAKYDPARSDCLNAVVVGGEVGIGEMVQPATGEMRLTYAVAFNTETRRHEAIFGRLTSGEMKVRDGIFAPIFDDPLTQVWARPKFANKFAQPPSADFRITLGIKMQLTRPFLLGLCKIGSDSDPITLNLTTGTTDPPPPNEPITGKPATRVGTDGDVNIYSATHVDNAFAVPKARDCIYKDDPVSSAVNALAKLPSAAGHNKMIMEEYIGRVRYPNIP